jgi:hypothetical protein
MGIVETPTGWIEPFETHCAVSAEYAAIDSPIAVRSLLNVVTYGKLLEGRAAKFLYPFLLVRRPPVVKTELLKARKLPTGTCQGSSFRFSPFEKLIFTL